MPITVAFAERSLLNTPRRTWETAATDGGDVSSHRGAQAISKVKGVLRSDACRDVGLLYEKIGDALRTVTRADAEAFMRHSGYTLR